MTPQHQVADPLSPAAEPANSELADRGVSTAGQSGYLPVSEHGLIGDLHCVALVGTNGTIDWYCCPSFDAASMFGSLLDADRGGCFELAAAVPAKTRQFYLPDTNVLITRFFAEDGVGEIQDFMPVGGAVEEQRHQLIRRVVCVRGAMPFRARVCAAVRLRHGPAHPHRGGGRGGVHRIRPDRWPDRDGAGRARRP